MARFTFLLSTALLAVVACTRPVRSTEPAPSAATPAPAATAGAPAATVARAFSAISPTSTAAPAPGDYAMKMSMRFETFVTTEMRITEARRGAARLMLAPGGKASACVGVQFHRSVQGQPHYEPDPAKRGHSESDDDRRVALAGTWRVEQGVARVRFDRQAAGTCDAAAAEAATPAGTPVVELTCVALAASARVPFPALGCTAAPARAALDLGLPLAGDGAAHDNRGPTGDALLFASPGIAVDAQQGRRDAAPTFTFARASADDVLNDPLLAAPPQRPSSLSPPRP